MWFYVALLTSAVSAITVIVSKKLIHGVTASVLTWATLALATPIILIFTLREGNKASPVRFYFIQLPK